MSDLRDDLISKIKILSDTVWDGRATNEEVNSWISNFNKGSEGNPCEQLHALYLLSQFMYFSSREIKELIKSVYRDLFKYPVVESIRRQNHDTTDIEFIENEFKKELSLTRFLGVGNPSESGSHLLYYFRQENCLPKHLFISTHEIFNLEVGKGITLADPQIKRYVFFDDFCGGGTQATGYLLAIVAQMKLLNPDVRVEYYVLFANLKGLEYLENNTEINKCDAVFKLDETYKCFGEKSRHKPFSTSELDWEFTEEFTCRYGKTLYTKWPLGHGDCQLLIGFFHNTPNNSLPILWFDDKNKASWEAIFKRYPKVYGDVR